MTFIEVLQGSQPLTITLVTVLGLLTGSFLNVVIHRVPIMLQRDWQQQCCEFLERSAESLKLTDPVPDHKVFNLANPPSHCPGCNKPIRPWQNVPVVSYILLKGKCAGCKTPIHWRYPTVEIATALLSGLVAWRFGATPACLAALILTWILISLTMIDLDHQLLPDNMTMPLLWLGLALSVTPYGIGTTAQEAVLGAVFGYLSLWSVYWTFRLLTGREGMGFGDFKLLAALGAWLGWQSLLGIIILSSLAGAVIGIALIILAGRDKNRPMPFGPCLATAGFIALIWGPQLNQWYLSVLT
ncbi:type 4 prepilin-like proteins leader peptide-processing enzyme [Pseudohongiella nitratireducens]|uniref:Prepilin leader peptidase/N-methyltransferase n=1 Tax=Pseudohongiella nitratireducens TaxID=1768907 RepID=A0A916VJI0_9GAMM|nr:A24 family peptidase [Pseudohongiella nitratireducens]MDF1623041.1 A24 family peptidase [Pseudohongiella nitratireducens]GFZ78893.1 type 4 prepilin-like proteins leader peptide-processing enzyme [Pseudohongiella nitratireducens]